MTLPAWGIRPLRLNKFRAAWAFVRGVADEFRMVMHRSTCGTECVSHASTLNEKKSFGWARAFIECDHNVFMGV